MDSKRIEIRVPQSWEGERLDKALPTFHEEWSRAQVQAWIRDGHVCIGDEIKKGNYRLSEGEKIQLLLPPIQEVSLEAESIPLDIRYEDADLLVVNKPPGMVVHPGAGNESGTLVHALLSHCHGSLSRIGGPERPGIVHRIDKDTSGLLVVAKNDHTHQVLARQLKDHSISRRYLAIVQGRIPHTHGTVDAPIGRDPHHRKRMTVVQKNGKPAVTHFSVQEYLHHSATFIACRLETGRTHQIRVHMKYIGFPILGDPIYGPKKRFPMERQALHAQKLQFHHPRSGKPIEVEAELPSDFVQALSFLRHR